MIFVGLVLPGALAWVLDMIGIEWPNIDEDDLTQGADQMRQLADELTGNTGQAQSDIAQMLSANSSQSLDLFNTLWQKLAAGHLPQLAEGLKAIGVALDASAALVVGMKAGAIVQLGILAAEIIADQAAAPFTFGASEAAIPGEVELTSQLVKQIFKKVAEQVEQALLSAVEGPVFSALGSAGEELAGQLLGDAVGTSSGLNVGAVVSAGEQGGASAVSGEANDPLSVFGISGSGDQSGDSGTGDSGTGDSGTDDSGTGDGTDGGSVDPSSADPGSAPRQMGPGLEIPPDTATPGLVETNSAATGSDRLA